MNRIIVIMLIIIGIMEGVGIDKNELNKIFTEEKIVTEDFIEDDISGTFEEHGSSMCSMGIDSNGKYFATGEIGKISIWDINSFSIINQIQGATGQEFYRCIDFSPEINILGTGLLNDNTIRIYNYRTGDLIKTLIGHTNTVTAIDFSPNGKLLASSSDDGSIKLWDVVTGKEINTFKVDKTYIKSVIFTNDGNYLIFSGNDSLIRIWDLMTGELKKIIKGHQNCVYSLDFSPNGKFLASGDGDGVVSIWNTDDWSQKNSYKTSLKESYYDRNYQVESLKFSSDSKYLVSGNQEKNITVFNLDKGEKSISFYTQNPIWSVKFSKNAGYIISDSRYKLVLWEIKNFNYKSKTNKKTDVKDNEDIIIASLPINFIGEINKNTNKIIKPVKGNINSNDFEILHFNDDRYSFYTVKNAIVYSNPEKTRILNNIEKSKIINTLYYSKDLNMFYLDEGNLKGWIELSDIGLLEDVYNKVAIINNNTNSYKNVDSVVKSMHSSGDIIEFEKITEDLEYFYSEKDGWINKKEVAVITESNKNQRVFVSTKETKFNNDFTGYNYKTVPIGTEYILIGVTDKYNLVISKLTGEKGWIQKKDMSFTKPDLNDPIIMITNASVDENNMLTISGKIYDDTAIRSFLLNNNKMSTKPLSSFDTLGYVPEVGYSFNSQWFLIEGIENNVEIKVIDRDGKSYSKVLKYTPELKTVNLNDFQIENIIKKLPKLEYIAEIKDSNEDNVLSGSEKMTLTVKVTNGGEGEARNVILNITNSTSNNLTYRNLYPLGTIQPNETKIAVIDIIGNDDIAYGKALFDLQINEQNGFNPFPAKFSFNTEPKLNPKLEILDYALDDENKNGQIEQNEKFDLYVLVQNTGEGDSKNSILDIKPKANGIISMAETIYKLDSVKSGESKKIKFTFVTNYLYKGNGDLPFDISFYDEKSKAEKPITLAMNKVVPTIKEVNLESKKKEIKVASKISIMSDIDDTSKLIAKNPNTKKWAVVIGVENYKKAPYVEFAERDALVTKEYFNKLLGVPTENTFYLSNSDATKTELETLLKSTLKNRVSKEDEVYFYFSGHGVPTNEGESYLLLNDSDPSNPRISAYAIKELYEDLGSLKTTKSYAFLDTCFSGGTGRTDKVDTLLEGTRPGVMKVNDISLVYSNLVVFTATDINQLSNSYKEQNHGLFTYYMLKGIKGDADNNKDENVSLDELQSYIKDNVSRESSKLGDTKIQQPLLKTTVDRNSYIY